MFNFFRIRRSSQEHWNKAYTKHRPTEVGWFQQRPELSLELIASTGVGHDGAIIDVGGGASTLIDGLLDEGYRNTTVLDISAQSLSLAKERLGERSGRAAWIEADVTAFHPAGSYDLWHDRAVFHFLTRPADRQRYVQTLKQALRIGGQVILATFGPKAPPKCSGLRVMRYTPEFLHAELGPDFKLVATREELHRTPTGVPQQFFYCHFIRQG